MEVPEFDALFLHNRPGTLIQPTATNKPGSSVYIKSFTSEELATVFGTEWKDGIFKASLWSQGGIFQGKGKKLGPVDVECGGMEVSYSHGTLKAG